MTDVGKHTPLRQELIQRARTIKGECAITGIGLFTGQPSSILLEPLSGGSGIVVQRGDSQFLLDIHSLVEDPAHTTAVGNQSFTLRSVEHLLAAIRISGVTDLRIRLLSGSEVPADGSGACRQYLDALESVGFVDSSDPSSLFRTVENAHFAWEGSSVQAIPSQRLGLRLRVIVDFPEPIGSATLEWESSCPKGNNAEVPSARGFIRRDLNYVWPDGRTHWDQLHDSICGLPPRYQDLGMLSFTNGVWNTAVQPNEPAWHKVMDLLGDLMLLGGDLQGDFVFTRPGHAFNHRAISWMLGSYHSRMARTARTD